MRVEIRLDAVYIFEKIIQGSGGLPRNWWQDVTNVYGGIDSPVAGMEVMKRGVTLRQFTFIVHHLQVRKLKIK